MHLRDLVKTKRLSLNESQKQFAKRFGISHAAISDLERGKAKYISFQLADFLLYEEIEKIRPSKAYKLGRESFVKQVEDIIGEFGDDPNTCLGIVAEATEVAQ